MMGQSLAQAAQQLAFHPDQVRGPDGKWIKVGDVVESATHGIGTVKKVHKDVGGGKVTVRFNGEGENGTSRLLKASEVKKKPRPGRLSEADKAAREKRLNDLDRA